MSIPPESPWRGGAAFLSQPIKNTDERAAEMVVETIYGFNCRSPVSAQKRLVDIEYRSSDREKDVQRHVFRWDRAPYDFVFLNGFEARRQAGTPNETYYNLELYVNSGGRPLDVRRETTHAFVSTTLSSSWFPRVNPGVVDRVYRYEIYAPGGIWVAETLGDRYRYAAQDEVAFPAGIAVQYIRSAQLFELYTERQHPRRRRVDTTLFINTNFNPQSHPPRSLRIQRPVCDYTDDHKRRKKLVIHKFPQQKQKKAAVVVTDDDSTTESYIDSAFRSLRTDQAYLFIKNEYITKGGASGSSSSDHRIINGPLFISSGYPSLVGTAFAEYGIDAAFSCDGVDEAFIFSSNLCAKIKYAPGTQNDKIIEGPKTIKQMFPFFKGTEFEKGVDAAFESTVTGEAYLFKGSSYARISYSKRSLIGGTRPIIEGFRCFKKTIFESDIGAAFASHKPNEAYLFKDNKYVLLHFTPGTAKDYIKEGPKDIVPNNWKSLKDILPHKNRGLDYYDSGKFNPQCDQDS